MEGGDLKVGGVCIIAIKEPCPKCAALNGLECAVVGPGQTQVRRGCNGGLEIGTFYECTLPGRPASCWFHRSELQKKKPPADPDEWIRQETVPRENFDAWLASLRERAKAKEPA